MQPDMLYQIAMLYQYNPFNLTSQQATVRTPRKIYLASACMDRYDDFFLAKVTDGERDLLMQVDSKGGVEAEFDLGAPAIPFVRPTHNHVLLFVPSTQVLHLVSLAEVDVLEIPLANPSQSNDSQYELHSFSKASKVCLAEKNARTGNLKLTFFNFTSQETPIVQTNTYEAEAGVWNGEELYEVTSFGKIGWCGRLMKKLDVKLFEGEKGLAIYSISFEALGDFPLDEEFKVLAMWQIGSMLYFIINPINASSLSQNYSPIIKVDLSRSNDLQPQFVYQQSCAGLVLKDCINLDDYVILFSAIAVSQGKTSSYLYSKELEQIGKEEQVSSSLKPIKASRSNTYLLVGEQNGEQFTVVYTNVSRVNSLPFQRVLELTERAEIASKSLETAIIIFGADKTGKSTLRHYLAGDNLVHRYNEQFGFYQVVAEVDEMAGLEHEEQREWLPWMNCTDKAAIIDIPDWNHRGDFFKAQIRILLSRCFRAFRHLHFVITIPEEYIEDSYKNEEFFSSALSLIGRDDNIQDYMSIVLTKVETAEDSLASFAERIEEITDINQESGSFIKGISEGQRILAFENREIRQGEGKEMLEKLISFGNIQLFEQEMLTIEQDLRDSSPSIDSVFYQSEYYIRIINAFLLRTCQLLTPALFPYISHQLNAKIAHNQHGIDTNKKAENKDDIGVAFVCVLAKLRAVLGKQEHKTQHGISELKELLLRLAEAVESEIGEKSYFADAVLAFSAVLRNALLLPLEHSSGKQEEPFAAFIKILQDQPEGILGQNLKAVIGSLQAIPAVQSCSQLQQFSSLFSKGLPKVKRVVYVEMSYEEEKQEIGKRRESKLEVICSLPANALKLDLICEELLKFTRKEKLESNDYKQLCFYLREASRICQYHGLFYEALVLLYVVPDFTGIQKLVDDLAQHLKVTTSYESKKLLNKEEGELVEKLLSLARDCLRDGLARKLINLWTLSNETSSKPANLRKDAQTKAAKYLSTAQTIKNYRESLQKREVKEFYNLADADFKKLLSEKDALVKKCLALEQEEGTKRHFEDTQAMRYIMDDLPIPA